ncbi:MAG: DNA pilot protein [Microvirus sp.]|nr:MAG: DNA pilot protein [Microvirus sp.]
MGNLLETLGTPGAGLIGGLAQGVINAFQSRSNIDRQNQKNLELAKYQYSTDLDMWNKGNQYNAPAAQMSRLKAAGLNPNLVYGSGTVAGQSAQQLPKFNAPQMEYNYQPPVNLPETLGQTQDYRIQQAQIDNMKAQRASIEEQTLARQIQNQANQKIATISDDRGSQTGSFLELLNLGKLQKQLQSNEQQRKMFPGQFEGQKFKNRLTEEALQKMYADIALINAKKAYTNLQRDMMTPAFWARTLTGAGGLLKGMFGKGASKIPSATPFRKSAPRVTPRSSPAWRQVPSRRISPRR